MRTRQYIENRTRNELARQIENFKSENHRSSLLHVSCPVVDDRKSWYIHHDRMRGGPVGVLKRNKIIDIVYNGTEEQAILADDLRLACEAKKICYTEKKNPKYMKDRMGVKFIREKGHRLLAIADRMEALF